MSAYVLDDIAISQVARFLVYGYTIHQTTFHDYDAETCAKRLHALNCAAVGQRYPDSPDMIEGAFTYDDSELHVPTGQSLKTLECLICQCSEGDVVESESYRQLERAAGGTRRRLLEAHCSDYRNASWGAYEPPADAPKVYGQREQETPMIARRLDLGSVGLSERAGEYPAPLIGSARVSALDLIYRQQPCRYVPVDNRSGNGWRELSWSEIEWRADYYHWGTDHVRGLEVQS